MRAASTCKLSVSYVAQLASKILLTQITDPNCTFSLVKTLPLGRSDSLSHLHTGRIMLRERHICFCQHSMRNSAIYSIYNLMSWCGNDLLCLGHLWGPAGFICWGDINSTHDWKQLTPHYRIYGNVPGIVQKTSYTLSKILTFCYFLYLILSLPSSTCVCVRMHRSVLVCVYPFIP